MIYTITTNPSLDYTVEADLVPGQINRTRSEVIYPGGKGINVSLFLQRLGMETLVLGFAAGRIGQAIRDLLDDLGCPHELMELSGGGQSRIFTGPYRNHRVREPPYSPVQTTGNANSAARTAAIPRAIQSPVMARTSYSCACSSSGPASSAGFCGSGGSSRREEICRHRKKFCVVPYKSGRPGSSSLPRSSSRPFAVKLASTPEQSTPRTCSTNAFVTGWL